MWVRGCQNLPEVKIASKMPLVEPLLATGYVGDRKTIPPDRRYPVPEAKITIREDASLRIEADTPLVDHEGNVIPTPEGRPYSLCRCGGSSRKLFCDGSHKTNGFDGTLARE